MENAIEIKNERINLRLKGKVKNLLKRAASFEGKTVSNFILISAMERAEDTIRKHEAISLNAKNSEIFLNALSKDLNFNQKLTEAFKEHSRRTTSK